MTNPAINNLPSKIFITGTDTDAGKTFSTCLLAKYFNQQGLKTVCLKPVAAGAELINGELRNDDALKLRAASSEKLGYQQVNPICLEPAIAPHIAAEKIGQTLSIDRIEKSLNIDQYSADKLLIEGAGGWLVPLNDHQSFADLALRLTKNVVLVVGMKLGCINHALLTVQAIRAAGGNCVGWIANQVDPTMAVYQENLATLQKSIGVPLIATVDYDAKQLTIN
ncbi:MAG: dethiobiotin synthase [Kangiellaceae bacterium]|jgi:dethiobiotin synthetase|nr:dethiobiotin synthase [Kangiellaceae bacterium]